MLRMGTKGEGGGQGEDTGGLLTAACGEVKDGGNCAESWLS